MSTGGVFFPTVSSSDHEVTTNATAAASTSSMVLKPTRRRFSNDDATDENVSDGLMPLRLNKEDEQFLSGLTFMAPHRENSLKSLLQHP